MKKFTGVLMLAALFLMFGTAQAKVFYISLPSGVSVVASLAGVSGSSVFQRTGAVGVTSFAIRDLNGSGATPFVFIQLDGSSGLTVSQSERVSAGNNSGTTLTVWFRESLIDTGEAWSGATKYNVWDGMPFSGTSMAQVPVRCYGPGFIQFGVTSGITTLGAADFVVNILDR